MPDLFEELTEKGEDGINQLIQERRQEAVDLEFKTKANNSHGRLDKEDKKVLAKILSAFSNSAGGLLIYGISAQPNEDRIDCATAPQAIAEIERFQSEVTRAVGELLKPLNEGIRVSALASGTPGSGYLAIQVDRSERRPHRSEAPGDKHYYKRVGSSSYAMEHYDIEDAFKRQQRAELKVTHEISPEARLITNGPRIVSIEFIITFSLENISAVTARFPYLHILSMSQQLSILAAPSEAIGLYRKGLYFDGGADHVINPSVSRLACRLRARFRATEEGYVVRAQDLVPLNVQYRSGCEHSRATEDAIEISDATLRDILHRTQNA